MAQLKNNLYFALAHIPRHSKTLTQKTNSGTMRVGISIQPKWVSRNENTLNRN